jgi:hypothetical protein
MRNLYVILIVVSLGLTGCERHFLTQDYIPPAPPTGLRTLTGDNFIELLWKANRENDLAGYNVFVSSSYSGRYELIGTTHEPYYKDNGARNGSTYYYAVTAFDYDGNESDLSRDVVYDIPRPEGYNVTVTDYRSVPASAGYDFSDYSVVAYNSQNVDMYYEYYAGDYYMNVRTDSDIQDMGPTSSLLDIGQAPSKGWSATHDVLLFPGHTYVVWTWDDHYAKFRVVSMSPGRLVFDWAYQLQPSNPLLKRGSAQRSQSSETTHDRTKTLSMD